MASQKQILANRQNATRATGPKSVCGKQVTRFNRLKHGLRAEQIVLPGESAAEFEAERAAWFDDWKPGSQTRAVLVERAAAASWRLRRSVRVETARLRKLANAAAVGFDAEKKGLIEAAMRRLNDEPAAALAMLKADPAGIDHLIGLWVGLHEAITPDGWVYADIHHGRLLALLGYPVGTNPNGIEVAIESFYLTAANNPDALHGPEGPLTQEEKEDSAEYLREICDEQLEELRALRGRYWEATVIRSRAIDAASVDTSKEALLQHRYEMAHDRSLRATINQLMALHRSGADLAEEEDEPVVATQIPDTNPVAPTDPVAPTEPNPAESAAPTEPNPGSSVQPEAPTEPNFAGSTADSAGPGSVSGRLSRLRGMPDGAPSAC